MSTFLELCQKVARESGTIQGSGLPAAVTGQTGRLLKIVNWTADAWTRIQNLESQWLWMQGEFPSTALTSSGTIRYTAASWNITDLAEWGRDNRDRQYFPHSIYLNATGVSDENAIYEITWEWFRTKYLRGTQTNARPTEYAISPANEFCLGAPADAVYRLNGIYRKTAQTLSANSDTPNCPSRFHDIIVWRALLLLAEHDEAPFPVGAARLNYGEILGDLRRDQLPAPSANPAPLA